MPLRSTCITKRFEFDYVGVIWGRDLRWKPRAPKLRVSEGPVERETAYIPESIESAIGSVGEEADGR